MRERMQQIKAQAITLTNSALIKYCHGQKNLDTSTKVKLAID